MCKFEKEMSKRIKDISTWLPATESVLNKKFISISRKKKIQ
jgi:hypothetical protein